MNAEYKITASQYMIYHDTHELFGSFLSQNIFHSSRMFCLHESDVPFEVTFPLQGMK